MISCFKGNYDKYSIFDMTTKNIKRFRIAFKELRKNSIHGMNFQLNDITFKLSMTSLSQGY